LGIVILAGWVTQIGPLMTVLPGRIAMKPNTAVAFLCAGIALVLLARPYDSSRFRAGRGARFKIYWPRTAQSGYPAQAVHSPSGLPGGSETILLVEDDDAMRELTCKCLAAVGYNVLTAQDGEVAIRVCSRHDGPIHLLLTDVVMPGISGRQLSNSLAALRPELKVLYMSGYTADLIADHGVLESNMALLEKPFTQELLLNKLRSVLDCSLAAGMAGAG
jgi:two-component system cell cycle sensor histidine kinase/response regulator CckA